MLRARSITLIAALSGAFFGTFWGAPCSALCSALPLPSEALPQEKAEAEIPSAEPTDTFYATATVRKRSVTEATAAVSVLDRQAIEASGASTVAQLLRFLPGVDLVTNATRGGDPNFTLVLIDGVAVNDGTYQVGEVFNFEALPAAAVERVEVVRGPISAIYGSTGLAGAIHIFTRRGSGDVTRLEAQIGAGDADLQEARATISGPVGRGGYLLHASHQQEEGRIADERFELLNLQGTLQFPVGKSANLRLASRVASWEGDDYPDASGGPLLGSGLLRTKDHREISLGIELRAGGRERIQHKVTAGVYRHDLVQESPAVFPLVPASSEDTRFTRIRLGWATTFKPRENLQVSIGADVHREEGDNRSLLLLPPFLGGDVPGDYSLERTSPGLYTELLVRRGHFAFELGSRIDLPDGGSAELSPRLGVSYRPGGGETRLRASLGRAFKLPSFFASASPPQLGGNPALEPEEMIGADVGIERHWENARVEAGVSLFAHRYKNLVDFDFATFSHVNRSSVQAEGVESFLAWTPRESLSLGANLTWQDVEDRDTSEALRHRPEWVRGLRLSWRPLKALELHLGGQWTSSILDEQIPVPQRREVDGYVLTNLGATWKLTPVWALHARIDNLTDEDHETLIGFPGAGRSFRVGLRYGLSGR